MAIKHTILKVLWFSNTPALGLEFLNKNNRVKGTGGWMHALNKAIQDHVDLSVSFHYPYKLEPFNYQQTKFYPVYTGNIVIENLRSRFLGKVYDVDFLDTYIKVIKEVDPDIIHIHETENPFLNIIEYTDIPVVVSIQGNLTVCHHKFLSGLFSRYLNTNDYTITINNLLFGFSNFKRDYNSLQKMAIIEQRLLRKTKHILGRTGWDRRITSILAPDSKYYHGEEMLREGFYQNIWKNKFSQGKIVIFTTNGNNYYKGFETLCHSLHLLNEAGFEVEWRVAGVSNNSLINKITKKFLGKNYPRKGLILLGSLDEVGLIENLKNSHIYVMPSHIENSPNNLCEAMILGMPCIATFAGGTGFLLKDSEEGILVQDGDPWVMAGAILEIISNPEEACEMGRNARTRALSRHDKEAVIINLITVYKEIIDAN